ncbi:MAG: Stk1 family PASTA domain-containing Ser/Thr kinase [Defluviitaleaceae bacterium]|nr:Stk1 family PASTA domain-containing Ser/Thr kinase [Defluviitaleaceae bacterium]
MILEVGAIISNKYQILEQIGSGGMSHVYRALDTNLGREVTFKVLKKEYVNNAGFLARFDSEARSIARLNHPNIVNVYDVGNEDEIKYIVMEYIKGKTLKELIQDKAPFSNETMLGVAEQITSALIHAHENNIVHKDIKPQNILVTPNGTAKLADFGISDDVNSREVIEAGSTMGSVHYVSPEAVYNNPVDLRSDLYSLGITMFEMMTGTLPFDAEDADTIPSMHAEAPFPNVIKRNPAVLPLVREIISKLTQKQPSRRYQSAVVLYNDIQRAIMECAKYKEFYKETKSKGEDKKADAKTPPLRSTRQPNPQNKRKEQLQVAAGIGAAIVVIVLLIIGIVHIVGLFSRGDDNASTTPPYPMVGRHINDIYPLFANLDLELEKIWQADEDVAEGYIIESNVYAQGFLDPGTVITVLISTGSALGAEVAVPDITGLTIAQATTAFANVDLYLNAESSEFHNSVPQNHIISQNPMPGASIPAGSTVYITYSLGTHPDAAMSTVPNLIGLTETQARSQILTSNLTIGEVTTGESATHPQGTVISQSVAFNQQRHAGTAIDFVVSSGVGATTPPNDPQTPPTTTPPTEEPPVEQTPDPEPPVDDTNGDNDEDEEPPVDDTPPAPITHNLSLTPFIFPEETATLTLMRRTPDGLLTTEQTRTATAADLPWNVTVSGTGSVEFVLLVNGVEAGTQTVNFGD